ncbi:MAG: amidase, partial [Gemmatimonadota bacterium]
MDRRGFIGASLVGGASLAVGSTGCTRTGPGPEATSPSVAPFALDEITIAELHRSMESGERTARSITELYLRRIEALDRQGPELRAIIETNPDALAIADALDAERRATGPRGPLHGIPIALKDNIDTGDGMHTTAGSLALLGSPAPIDAHVAERLRAAGAVILAKSNLSEWANFRSTRSSSGWSARGGQCRNPYILDRSPCGSSSGSGVAVAANLCAVAVGTETDGSVVCPAAINGIVGIKPTLGLVSRAGIVPIAHSQDTAGPMARTVADAAALLAVMIGPDPRDPVTAEAAGRSLDLGAILQPGSLRGARLGLARDMMGFHDKVDGLMEEAVAALRDAGAQVVDFELGLARKEIDDAELEVLAYEFKADIAAYLATRPDLSHRTLADLIAFNEANRDTEMRYFGQELFTLCQKKGSLETPEYLKALATSKRLTREAGIDKALAAQGVEAIMAPTASP